jgi:hypothetical protein
MAFGGIIAGAMGGGAQAVGQIAEGQIQNNQRIDLAKEQAAIDEAKQLRIAQANEQLRRSANEYDTTGAGGTQKLDYQARSTAQTNAAALDQSKAMVPVEAERAGAVATATGEAATQTALDQGSNPAFLKAVAALESAKESSGTRASAALASAEAQLKGEQLRDFKDLRTEYDAVKLLQNDASLSDAEKQAKIAQHTQNIDLIKLRNSSGKAGTDITAVAQNAANLIKLADAASLEGDTALAKQYRDRAAAMSIAAGDKKLPGLAGKSDTSVPRPVKIGQKVGNLFWNGGDPALSTSYDKNDPTSSTASTAPVAKSARTARDAKMAAAWQAGQDPEIKALETQAAQATGRKAMLLNQQADKIRKDKYGLD